MTANGDQRTIRFTKANLDTEFNCAATTLRHSSGSPTPGLAVDLPTSAVQPDLTSDSNPIPSGPDSELGSGNGIGCSDDTEFDQALSSVCPFTAEVGDDQSQSQMLDVARHHVSCNSDLLLNKLERLGLLQKSEVALNRRVCDGFEEMVQQEFDQIRARIADIYDQ